MFGWKKPAAVKQASARPLAAKERGRLGEDTAIRVLEKQGYTVVERNWRPGNALRGEIDCIAWTRGSRGEKVLAFVEVKTRRDNLQGAPQEAVTLSKQKQIARLANAYVSMHRLDNIACRFDVVEVWLQNDMTARCAVHANAFEFSA